MMKNQKHASAQSLLEFALVIPLVIFSLTVFLDLGRAIYAYSALSNSVREGTRYAMVNPMYTSAEKALVEKVIKDYSIGIDSSKITVTITPATSTDNRVTIKATYPFVPVTPGLMSILGGASNIALKVQSSVQVAPVNLP